MVIFLMGDDILWTFQCLVSSYSSSSLFRSFFCTPDTISSSQTLLTAFPQLLLFSLYSHLS